MPIETPKLSVIMPVYNAEKFLKDSIESVLNQTFSDFEFIIINDGSTDNSLKIIKAYANKDERIKIIDQNNLGIVESLNQALKLSTGQFIARMDADDISEPDRLEKQLNFLIETGAYLCGTWATIIDEKGQITGQRFNYPPKTWRENKMYLLRGNPFIHPSIMLSRKVYEVEKDKNGNLYRNYKHLEDYELWTRIVPKYKSVNLPEYLLRYRIHQTQITKKNNFGMRISGLGIRSLAVLRLAKSIF